MSLPLGPGNCLAYTSILIQNIYWQDIVKPTIFTNIISHSLAFFLGGGGTLQNVD